MRIEIKDFVSGAKEAEGIAVVIDVFRAFTVVCYAFGQGAKEIIPVGTVEEALAWKTRNPEVLLVGERHARKIEGFDFGNSPTEISNADLRGRVLVHTTHAGTQGLVNATLADEILTGSFANANATAAYIRKKDPSIVTLIRMGHEAVTRSDEDDLCAEYLEALLSDRPYDSLRIPDILRASPCSRRFFDPAQPWNPPSDFELCVQVNRFPFPVCARKNAAGGSFLVLSPEGDQRN